MPRIINQQRSMAIFSRVGAALRGLKTHQILAALLSVTLSTPALAHGDMWPLFAVFVGILLFIGGGLAALAAKLAPRGKKARWGAIFFFGILFTCHPILGLIFGALSYFTSNRLDALAFLLALIAFFVAWAVFLGWLVRGWRREKRTTDLP